MTLNDKRPLAQQNDWWKINKMADEKNMNQTVDGYFPMFFNIAGKKILIAGGGNIALRRIRTLTEFHADITVMAPALKDEIRELLSIPGKRPIGALNSEIIMLGLGGAVKEIKKEETAFYYRDAEYMLKYSMTWEDDMYANNNMKNYKREYLQFRKFITGAYVNFPYHGIPYYHTNYYGMNLEELKRIKECYDPENIFEFQQSI